MIQPQNRWIQKLTSWYFFYISPTFLICLPLLVLEWNSSVPQICCPASLFQCRVPERYNKKPFDDSGFFFFIQHNMVMVSTGAIPQWWQSRADSKISLQSSIFFSDNEISFTQKAHLSLNVLILSLSLPVIFLLCCLLCIRDANHSTSWQLHSQFIFIQYSLKPVSPSPSSSTHSTSYCDLPWLS